MVCILVQHYDYDIIEAIGYNKVVCLLLFLSCWCVGIIEQQILLNIY